MALFVQKVPSQPELGEGDIAGDVVEQGDIASSSGSDNSSSELESEVRAFRQQTLQLYLSIVDGRTSWNTLIQVKQKTFVGTFLMLAPEFKLLRYNQP